MTAATELMVTWALMSGSGWESPAAQHQRGFFRRAHTAPSILVFGKAMMNSSAAITGHDVAGSAHRRLDRRGNLLQTVIAARVSVVIVEYLESIHILMIRAIGFGAPLLYILRSSAR